MTGSSGLGGEDHLSIDFVLKYRACLVLLVSVPVSYAIIRGFGISSVSSNSSCASDTCFGRGTFGA